MSYILESHRGAHIYTKCPLCYNNTFQLYRSLSHGDKGGDMIANNVGKCGSSNCRYHYSPEDFQKEVCFIPDRYFNQSLINYKENNLFLYLAKLYGEPAATKAMKMYLVGTSNKHPGATIFWRKDSHGRTQNGTVILINANTGRGTVKGDVRRELKLKNVANVYCLFGEHLLRQYPLKTVVIAENEKSAIVASCKHPEYIWLAPTNPSFELCNSETVTLKGRNVICEPKSWDIN